MNFTLENGVMAKIQSVFSLLTAYLVCFIAHASNLHGFDVLIQEPDEMKVLRPDLRPGGGCK